MLLPKSEWMDDTRCTAPKVLVEATSLFVVSKFGDSFDGFDYRQKIDLLCDLLKNLTEDVSEIKIKEQDEAVLEIGQKTAFKMNAASIQTLHSLVKTYPSLREHWENMLKTPNVSEGVNAFNKIILKDTPYKYVLEGQSGELQHKEQPTGEQFQIFDEPKGAIWVFAKFWHEQLIKRASSWNRTTGFWQILFFLSFFVWSQGYMWGREIELLSFLGWFALMELIGYYGCVRSGVANRGRVAPVMERRQQSLSRQGRRGWLFDLFSHPTSHTLFQTSTN